MRKVVPLIVVGGVLLASGGTLGAVEASAKTIDLIVDGAPQTVRTYQGTVGGLLRAEGIQVVGQDIVSPSMGTKLTRDSDVKVSFARPIDLTLDGKDSTTWTTARTVGDFTAELGVRPESEVSQPADAAIPREGTALEITTAKRITVIAGPEDARDSVTTASTVAEALADQGIKLGDKDKVKPDRTAAIDDGMTITVEFRDEKRTTKDVEIPNKTVRKETDSLPRGTEEVQTEGHPGKATEEWVEKFVNGKSVSNERVKRTVVTEPEDRVIRVGTGDPDTSSTNPGSSGSSGSGSSGGSGPAADLNDEGLTGTGQIETCEASNYGNGDGFDGGPTASGETFDKNAMTAAHKTLPLGTKVRVTNQANGKSVVVRINDRGPYAAGRCIDLSSGSFAKIAAPSAGVAQVKVEVLK